MHLEVATTLQGDFEKKMTEFSGEVKDRHQRAPDVAAAHDARIEGLEHSQ